MARLTAAGRKKLPASDFALGKGHYPIENEVHAREALGRINEFGDSAEKARVRRAVHRKYPKMQIKGVMHDGGPVDESGAYKLEKGEVVIPKEKVKKMSMSARAEAHLGGKKSKHSKKHVHHVNVRRSHNGGYIAENHHDPDPDTGETPPMEEHTLPDMDSVQQHMAESMPQEAPPDESAAASPAPAGGAAPPPPAPAAA